MSLENISPTDAMARMLSPPLEERFPPEAVRETSDEEKGADAGDIESRLNQADLKGGRTQRIGIHGKKRADDAHPQHGYEHASHKYGKGFFVHADFSDRGESPGTHRQSGDSLYTLMGV